MKKKLLALVCALALTFSFAGCTISTPDTVGSIGDFEITSGMYLLAQYGAYQQAAQLAGSDQDASDVKWRRTWGLILYRSFSKQFSRFPCRE